MVGFFTGVVTNSWLIEQSLQIRFAIIICTVLITATALSLYGFLIHGIMETFGALAGDPLGLICLLGYTTLPRTIMTASSIARIFFMISFLQKMYSLVSSYRGYCRTSGIKNQLIL